MDVWPRGSCWLQDEACQVLGVPVGCKMKHAKGLLKRPIRSHSGVASGWPEEAMDVWPRGGCWLQDEACQVSVLMLTRYGLGAA